MTQSGKLLGRGLWFGPELRLQLGIQGQDWDILALCLGRKKKEQVFPKKLSGTRVCNNYLGIIFSRTLSPRAIYKLDIMGLGSVLEDLSIMHESLGSNPSTTKNNSMNK